MVLFRYTMRSGSISERKLSAISWLSVVRNIRTLWRGCASAISSKHRKKSWSCPKLRYSERSCSPTTRAPRMRSSVGRMVSCRRSEGCSSILLLWRLTEGAGRAGARSKKERGD